MAENCCRK